MSSIPTLEGQHVRLEPLRIEHAEGLLKAAQGHAEAFKLTTVPSSLPAMKSYIESALVMHAQNGALPFATVRRSDHVVVGSTRLANNEFWIWPNGNAEGKPHNTPDATEIGWTWLTPAAQRTAINTEAKLLMLTFAFEAWKVQRVTLKTDERNAKSRANIERIGGKLDGLFRAHMPAADGGIRTSAVYSILASEWPDVRKNLHEKLHRK